MTLRELIKVLRHPDHLQPGQNVLDMPVEFFTGYFQPKAELLSVYVDRDSKRGKICVDIGIPYD